MLHAQHNARPDPFYYFRFPLHYVHFPPLFYYPPPRSFPPPQYMFSTMFISSESVVINIEIFCHGISLKKTFDNVGT